MDSDKVFKVGDVVAFNGRAATVDMVKPNIIRILCDSKFFYVGKDEIDHCITIDDLKIVESSTLTNEEDMSKVERFKEIVSNMAKVYEAKNKDYGNSFDRSIDKYGYVSFFVRSNDKIERAESIITSGKAEVKDESIMDTLLDNAVYCIMAAMKVEEDIASGNDIKFTKE